MNLNLRALDPNPARVYNPGGVRRCPSLVKSGHNLNGLKRAAVARGEEIWAVSAEYAAAQIVFPDKREHIAAHYDETVFMLFCIRNEDFARAEIYVLRQQLAPLIRTQPAGVC